MAKANDKEDQVTPPAGTGPQAEPIASPPSAEPQPGPQQPGQAGQIEVDDSKAIASYANFCRVTGTPEELIIDFGLNEHPFGAPTHPIRITQRIITNLFTAKRLLQVLHMTVQRHESAFGVLETDVQKRVRPGTGRAAR